MPEKVNGEWVLKPLLVHCESDAYHFLDVEEPLSYEMPTCIRIRSEARHREFSDIGPYVYLTLEDSRKLRAYLKMCEENYEERERQRKHG